MFDHIEDQIRAAQNDARNASTDEPERGDRDDDRATRRPIDPDLYAQIKALGLAHQAALARQAEFRREQEAGLLGW